MNPSSPNVRDALLKLTRALPAANGGTVTSPALDTGSTTGDAYLAGNVEFLLTAPALTVGQAANGTTYTYSIVGSPNADLSSATTLSSGILVQTGAGGAGAPAATVRYRPPSNAQRYIGFQVAASAGNADASAASATLELLV